MGILLNSVSLCILQIPHLWILCPVCLKHFLYVVRRSLTLFVQLSSREFIPRLRWRLNAKSLDHGYSMQGLQQKIRTAVHVHSVSTLAHRELDWMRRHSQQNEWEDAEEVYFFS